MNPLALPELFCQVSTYLDDKEKIFLASCSKITCNLKSLLILDSEYDFKEINNKCLARSIFIKEFSPENKIKELIKNSISESIIVYSSYIRFISNNTNVKLFYNEEIIKKIVSYECNDMAMKIMLNNNRSIKNINKQFIKASKCGYLSIVKLLIELGADIHTQNNKAIFLASVYEHSPVIKLLMESGANISIDDSKMISLYKLMHRALMTCDAIKKLIINH